MIFKQISVGTVQNFSYIIGDETTGEVAIVDPAWEIDKLLSICDDLNVKVSYIINTHSHSDHVEGNDILRQRTGAKVVMHASSSLAKDILVHESDTIKVGKIEMKVMHTPGHCPDHICLLFDSKLLTGDTLFVGECGRTDLAGGSSSDMYDSLNKILRLNDNTEVYPGHDYGLTRSSTIGFERQHNYTLKRRTREEFIQFMKEP